jgi:hypothetical protein
MAIPTLKHGSVVGKDATGTPIQISLTPGPGNFQIQGLEAGDVEGIPVYNRGTFLELVEGQDKAYQFSIELMQDGKLTDGSSGKPLDLVLKQGTISAGVTTDPGALVWTVDIVLTITRNAVTSTMTLSTCRCTIDFSEDAGGNKLSLSGTCYEGVVVA